MTNRQTNPHEITPRYETVRFYSLRQPVSVDIGRLEENAI